MNLNERYKIKNERKNKINSYDLSNKSRKTKITVFINESKINY